MTPLGEGGGNSAVEITPLFLEFGHPFAQVEVGRAFHSEPCSALLVRLFGE